MKKKLLMSFKLVLPSQQNVGVLVRPRYMILDRNEMAGTMNKKH